MNIFEAVKQSVTTRQAAESYGIRVNKNGMAVCPFHRDKNPSMKVDRRFHCFGCQADGDVIDFTAHLYNLKPKEAAEKLARDFSIHYENMGHSPPQRKQIKRQLTQEQRYLQAENRYFRALADYLHLLKQWKEECAPKQVEDVWHPLFMEALEKISETEYLLDTLLSGTLEERVAVVVAHGKEVTAIEQTLSPQTRQELCEVMDIMETELTVEEIREQLEMTQKGAVKNNRHNCKLILEHDPLLKDVFRHNILTEQTDIVKPVWWERISPAFTDMDLNYIMLYLEETYGLTMDKIVQKSIVHQADRNKYHPVRDYLNSLQWDGQERIRYVLHHFLGAPVDELTYESMKMFLLGAIARAFRPGIKFEYMLCLVGGQGVGKSTFFRFMAVKDDWFTDDIGKLDSEKVYCQLRGHWMIEMSEMVATARSKSIEETKSFLSRQKETYRDSYAVYALDRPRQCVFGGTSNIKRFLPFDRTGNRRFVPVQTNRAEMEVHILENEKESRQYIDQVWAEAMMLYRNGNFKLAFSKETETQLDKLRQEFMADDTEAGMIQAWLDEHEDRKVCSLMLFKEALDNPYVKPKKAETDRICEIMNTSIAGWKQGTMTRFKDYGTQRSWVCVNENCKRDAKDLKNENDWHPITEKEARQVELPFQ